MDAEQAVIDRSRRVQLSQTKITDCRVLVQILFQRVVGEISGDLIFMLLGLGKFLTGEPVIALFHEGDPLIDEPLLFTAMKEVVAEHHTGSDRGYEEDRDQQISEKTHKRVRILLFTISFYHYSRPACQSGCPGTSLTVRARSKGADM